MILTAKYDSSHDQRSWTIDSNHRMILGRSVDNDCCVPWDPLVSRQHAELTVLGPLLKVRCLPGVPRPINAGGRSVMEVGISSGESFQIGRTLFSVGSTPTASDGTQRKASGQAWQRLNPTDGRFSIVDNNASQLTQATTEVELAQRGLQILRQVLTSAHVIAVLNCRETNSEVRPQIFCSYTAEGRCPPRLSRSLIQRTITLARSSIKSNFQLASQTLAIGPWAFCIPMKTAAAERYCIYVAGSFDDDSLQSPEIARKCLTSDIQTTELVCQLMQTVYSTRKFERKTEGIDQFLPPCLRNPVAHSRPEPLDLRPQETDIVAIYCDLRGFSRMVSRASDDLQGLLQRVSAALGIITRSILDHQGAISDFQGDSALGFWGWPVASRDAAAAACRAALQIRRIFDLATKSTDGELNGFQVGIGIASGRAIAGRIGTQDQAKIGIFGPVVNLAARLEGLTKQTGATILLDSETARAAKVSCNLDPLRCRPMGSFRPAGFDDPADIHQLLPPETECGISTSHIKTFTNAVQNFQQGNWSTCRELLNNLPGDDHPRDFLIRQMELKNNVPPKDWTGIIDVQTK